MPAGADVSPAWRQRLAFLGREALVALPAGFSILPLALSSGVLVFAPLGPDFLSLGVTSGLYTTIFGVACAALIASSAPIISGPRTTLALIQAGATTQFITKLPGNVPAVIVALAACVFLAGALRILFAFVGVTRIIKYTPHPVLVGFINGAALSIMLAQLKPFVVLHGVERGWLPSIAHPATLVFLLSVTIFIFSLDKVTKKVPWSVVGLGLATGAFLLVHSVAPEIDLGRAIGYLPNTTVPPVPLLDLRNPEILSAVGSILPEIFFSALALATITTFESLLVFRMAQNLAERPFGTPRDVAAQGVGTCVSGLIGGLAFSPQAGQTRTAYRSGGRTRAVPLTLSVAMLMVLTFLPGALAVIPVAAISGLLLQNAIQNFDKFSLRLLQQTIQAPASPERRRAWYDLLVIGVVMAITVTISVIAGVLAGVALACIIFIANMSRPIVRRRRDCETMFSKRRRSAEDAEILRETGQRRIVLELHGVLFFGNADDLATTVTELFATADAIVLDLRGVADIDASGATIIRSLVERSRRRDQHLLFCNVAPAHAETIKQIVRGADDREVFPDLDSALEWTEEKVLQTNAQRRVATTSLPLEQHDLLEGLEPSERAVLFPCLVRKQFAAGTTICVEGDPADRMWLLVQGSVSIRLVGRDGRSSLRLASSALGTTIGEMAFIDLPSTRSASVVTDEDTVCYELLREAYDDILRSHPKIASKLLTNIGRDIARRLRGTSQELREIA